MSVSPRVLWITLAVLVCVIPFAGCRRRQSPETNSDTSAEVTTVTYEADDPFVIMLVQEHAKLVSRFINNGMEEIHKPYTLPSHEGESAVSKTRHLLLTSLIGTRTIFERIALNEEQHMSWLAIQLDLLERMGESAYISKHIPAPVTGTP